MLLGAAAWFDTSGQEDMLAATERIMRSEAVVEELKEQSQDLFTRKSELVSRTKHTMLHLAVFLIYVFCGKQVRQVQAIASAAASAVSGNAVSRVIASSPAPSTPNIMSPASRDITKVLKSAVCSLAAAGESQTLEKQALVAELKSSQELLREAEDCVVELKQSVLMWQELCQTLRDESSDLSAQVIILVELIILRCCRGRLVSVFADC